MTDPIITVRWLGVGGLEFRYQGRILLVDPFVTRPPLWKVALLPLQPNLLQVRRILPTADVILITHAHYDHLMDVPAILSYTNATAYGSPNTIEILRSAGSPVERCRVVFPGTVISSLPFRIQVLEGSHIPLPFFKQQTISRKPTLPLRVWDYKMDACYSYFIQVDNFSILIWHDMRGENAPPADVLFFNPEINPTNLQKMFRLVKPTYAIPIHWDDFFRPLKEEIRPFFYPAHHSLIPVQRLQPNRLIEQCKQFSPSCQMLLPERLVEFQLPRK